MYMVEKMDAGDIISQVETEITKEDNLGSLHDRLSLLGSKLLIETIPNIISGNIEPIKQNEEDVTYAYAIKREEEKIDFNKSTLDVFNQIRGLSPVPGAYSLLDGENVKIYSASMDTKKGNYKNGEIISVSKDGIVVNCVDGSLIIKEIQFAGKKKMLVKDYVNGIDKNSLIGKVFE